MVKQLIAALARSVASEVTYKTLAADVRTVAPAIDEETVSNYVGLLQRLFIVEAQRPWTPALRSRARVRTSPKLHLVDPALAAAALGAGPQQLRGDLNTLGTLFESAVVHDLTVLASRSTARSATTATPTTRRSTRSSRSPTGAGAPSRSSSAASRSPREPPRCRR